MSGTMKKLGKLRQWTDEKLGASQKTVATEEFRDMESEMQTRHHGLEAVHNACSLWMRSLAKKKEGQDKEKGTAIDLFGVALLQHGEDFAHESAYGQALTRLGAAEQKIGRAQEAFHTKVCENVLESMERSLAQMKELNAARKKLESRRLTYDSALSKCQKAKREDSRVEEELRMAKVRYEEVTDDVQSRMQTIRDSEVDNLNDLELIEAQFEFFDKSRDIMSQVRDMFHAEIGMRDGTRTRKVSHSSSEKEARIKTIITPPLSALCEKRDPFSRQPSMTMLEIPQMPQSRSVSRSSSSSEEVHTRPHLRRTQTSPRDVIKVIANFSFDAENENEMSIRTKDIIEVLDQVSEGWWLGQITGTTKRGLFPANYCSPLPNDIKQSQTFPRREPTPQILSPARVRAPPPPVPRKKSVIRD